MHRKKRNRFALLLAIFGLATLPFAASQGDAERGSDDSDQAIERRVRGRIDLPGPQMPGNLAGVLLREDRAAFEIDAALFRGDEGPGGVIIGGARRLHGPNAGRLFRLRGMWETDGQGKGVYRAVLLPLPSSAEGDGGDGDDGPEAVIKLQGRFEDPNGPALPPGRIRGRWSRAD